MPTANLLAVPRSLWTPQLVRESFERSIEERGGIVWNESSLELDEANSDRDKRSISGVARDASVGRHGFTYDLAGMDLRHFNELNPVSLAAHEQIVPGTLEPAAIAKGTRVTRKGQELHFRGMTFDTTPLASAWYDAIVAGFVRMVSVGAMPLEWEMVEEEDKKRKGGMVRYVLITKSELLEISPCPIGANRGAFIDPRHMAAASDAAAAAAAETRIARLESAIVELQGIVTRTGEDDEDEGGSGTEESYGDASFPDAAFIVERSAPKEGGKTVHRYRHLPHHSKSVKSSTENTTVDLPHLRNALARMGQVKPVQESRTAYLARAKSHLNAHARALLKSHKDRMMLLREIQQMPEFETDADDGPALGRTLEALSKLTKTLTAA